MLSKEMRERFINDIRGCSSGRLKMIRMILAQRVEILHAVGAPDDGSEEELKIIEEVIDGHQEIPARSTRGSKRAFSSLPC